MEVELDLHFTVVELVLLLQEQVAEDLPIQLAVVVFTTLVEAVDAVRLEKRELLLQDWASLQREFDRQSSLASTIDSASEVLASYERLYFGGLKSWLEVLNALQELSQSQLRLAQAGNATTLAYYRWRLRGGELPNQTNWMQ